MKTHDSVIKAVITGFKPYLHLIKNEVTEEDVERLLKIPIRRISLYDINKAKQEMKEINERLKEIKYHLGHIKEYALGFITGIKEKYGAAFKRNTTIKSFEKVDVREAAIRSLKLRYDDATGYLGYEVASGEARFDVSVYDKILVIKKNKTYLVMDAPDKVFVDKGMLYCALADKDEMAKIVFTILYSANDGSALYIKRCKIEKFIKDKSYELVPENTKIIFLTTKGDGVLNLTYHPKPKFKIMEESFKLKSYAVKGVKSAGVRLTTRQIKSCKFVSEKKKPGKK
jgi:topoisomerase-4 subunit A